MHPESGFRIASNWPEIRRMAMASQFADMTPLSFFSCCFVSLVKFSYWSKFRLNITLVLEFWQFTFIWDWPEIQKSEIPPSEFCPISRDWDELGIPNLAKISLIMSRMLLNVAKYQGYSSYRFWVIKGNPTGGTPPGHY